MRVAWKKQMKTMLSMWLLRTKDLNRPCLLLARDRFPAALHHGLMFVKGLEKEDSEVCYDPPSHHLPVRICASGGLVHQCDLLMKLAKK